jgi:peptidoglycan/xylan/chitin deacetylase (PgdA/CDA1 family)
VPILQSRYIMDKLRRLIYLFLGFLDKSILKLKPSRITILSYHSIANDNWRYSVDVEVIKKQIEYLQKNYDIIMLADVEAFLQGTKQITRPSVVLTFDDGYKDILLLKDFFISKQISPALFVLADSDHADFKELATKRPFLTVQEIQSLHNLGWEIGCHSGTHANLRLVTAEKLAIETIDAKQNLERSLGLSLRYFAYPRGKYNKQVIESVKKAGFSLGLTMDDGFITPRVNPLTIPRIGVDRSHSFDEFITLNSPLSVIFRRAAKKIIGRYL